MASPAAWVDGTNPDDAAVDVARRVLVERLDTVWSYLGPAAKKPDEDIEYVHQLRVSTRRAAAAVRLFQGLARKNRLRGITKSLRRIRRAAAVARDLDVLCSRLEQSSPDSVEGLTEAVRFVRRRRREVQKPLTRVYKSCKRDKWNERIQKLVKPSVWRKSKGKETFLTAAGSALASESEAFFDVARSGPITFDDLHLMRIRGKKLRYALEIVAGAFDASLKTDIYPEFLETHERLGVINDHVTACAMFRAWFEETNGDEYADVFRRFMDYEQTQADATRDSFLEWWTPGRCDQLARRFQTVLAQASRAAESDGQAVGLHSAAEYAEPSRSSVKPR